MNIKPKHAGSFYPADKATLLSTLESLFNEAEKPGSSSDAVISPHAGYIFSGKVAASAFNQINKNKKYDNVFVITSSHSYRFDGASVLTGKNYTTPLGEIATNKSLTAELVKKYSFFYTIIEAHQKDHSLEVQLPFIQYYLNHQPLLVPIIIGDNDFETSKKIANALSPYFNEKNLFVISSDFSHFPEYEDAIEVDRNTAEAICKNDIDVFTEALKINSKKDIKNLSTDICGSTAVMCLLAMTENKDYNYNIIDYQNSGDSVYGDKDRVVGYYAISVTKAKNNFELKDSEKEFLLKTARKSIEYSVIKDEQYTPELNDFMGNDTNLNARLGVFVTLMLDGKLRGCLGRFSSDKNLPETVAELSVASANSDYRFKPVNESELDRLKIEISVLSPMRKITSIDEITVGKHGICIKYGSKSGTFLPEVAVNMNWDVMEFVENCAVNKAGIKKEELKNADIFVYETLKFSE